MEDPTRLSVSEDVVCVGTKDFLLFCFCSKYEPDDDDDDDDDGTHKTSINTTTRSNANIPTFPSFISHSFPRFVNEWMNEQTMCLTKWLREADEWLGWWVKSILYFLDVLWVCVLHELSSGFLRIGRCGTLLVVILLLLVSQERMGIACALILSNYHSFLFS